MSVTENTHGITRHAAGRKRGRAWLPVVLALLGGIFVAMVIVQIVRGPEEPGPVEPIRTSHSDKYDPDTPVPEAGSEHEVPSPPDMFQELIENSGIDRLAEEEAVVRAKIEEYFGLISWDLAHKENLPHYKENRAALEAYLADLPPEMVPLLLEILRDETDFMHRYHLIRALGEIGSDLAADGLMERFDFAITHDKQKEIERTVEAIGIVDSDHSYDLINEYIDGEDPAVAAHRHRFVRQLGTHHRREESVPRFLDLAESDGDPRVRNKAAQALKRASDGTTSVKMLATAPEIERMLRTEKNEFVRQTMIGALGSIADRGSLTMLSEIARTDGNPTTRASAVESIYRIGGSRAEGILKKVAEEDDDEQVRDRARRRLRRLEEDR